MSVYTKTVWTDGVTPMSAEKMNNIENGIANAETAFKAYGFYDTASQHSVDLTNDNADVILQKDFNGDFQFSISALPSNKERIIAIHWEAGSNTLTIANSTSRSVIGDTWNSFTLSTGNCIMIRFTPCGDFTIATVKKV